MYAEPRFVRYPPQAMWSRSAGSRTRRTPSSPSRSVRCARIQFVPGSPRQFSRHRRRDPPSPAGGVVTVGVFRDEQPERAWSGERSGSRRAAPRRSRSPTSGGAAPRALRDPGLCRRRPALAAVATAPSTSSSSTPTSGSGVSSPGPSPTRCPPACGVARGRSAPSNVAQAIKRCVRGVSRLQRRRDHTGRRGTRTREAPDFMTAARDAGDALPAAMRGARSQGRA